MGQWCCIVCVCVCVVGSFVFRFVSFRFVCRFVVPGSVRSSWFLVGLVGRPSRARLQVVGEAVEAAAVQREQTDGETKCQTEIEPRPRDVTVSPFSSPVVPVTMATRVVGDGQGATEQHLFRAGMTVEHVGNFRWHEGVASLL